MAIFGGLGGSEDLIDFSEYRGDKFAESLNCALGDEMRDVIYGVLVCEDVWAALANVEWYNKEKDTAMYSFRAAGDLIASIRGTGDYLDWYCCKDYPKVAPYIRGKMLEKGWSAKGWENE